MRQSHIKLFDGMRVTAEHLDHLQTGLLTAIAELRLLHNQMPVAAGLEVSVQEERVHVQPGLAFDFQGQRIFSDSIIELPLNWQQDQLQQYVVVTYAQKKTGEVEGKFTMIWDSCEIVLAPFAPAAEDNGIVLAVISRGEDELAILQSDDFYTQLFDTSNSEEDDADAEQTDDASNERQPPVSSDSAEEPSAGQQESTDNSNVPADSQAVGPVANTSASGPAPQVNRATQGFIEIPQRSVSININDALREASAQGEAKFVKPLHRLDLESGFGTLSLQTEFHVVMPSTGEGGEDRILQANAMADISHQENAIEQTSTTHVVNNDQMRLYLKNNMVLYLPLFQEQGVEIAIELIVEYNDAGGLALVIYLRVNLQQDKKVDDIDLKLSELQWQLDIAWKGVP